MGLSDLSTLREEGLPQPALIIRDLLRRTPSPGGAAPRIATAGRLGLVPLSQSTWRKH